MVFDISLCPTKCINLLVQTKQKKCLLSNKTVVMYKSHNGAKTGSTKSVCSLLKFKKKLIPRSSVKKNGPQTLIYIYNLIF